MNIFKVSSSNLAKSAILRALNTNKIHTSSALQTKINYYEVLRVLPTASQSDIKEAYYKLSKVYHPDLAPQDDNSLRLFRSIAEAYDVLGNVKSRIEYDRQLGIESAAIQAPIRSTSSLRDADAGAIGPDYDKILGNKTAQEQWEDEEYIDRIKEVRKSKNRWYMDNPDYLRDPDENKLIFGGFYFSAVLIAIMYTNYYLDSIGY